MELPTGTRDIIRKKLTTEQHPLAVVETEEEEGQGSSRVLVPGISIAANNAGTGNGTGGSIAAVGRTTAWSNENAAFARQEASVATSSGTTTNTNIQIFKADDGCDNVSNNEKPGIRGGLPRNNLGERQEVKVNGSLDRNKGKGGILNDVAVADPDLSIRERDALQTIEIESKKDELAIESPPRTAKATTTSLALSIHTIGIDNTSTSPRLATGVNTSMMTSSQTEKPTALPTPVSASASASISPTTREKVNRAMSSKWGFVIFCALGPVLCIISCISLIIGIHEYNSASNGAAKGATVDDFVSIGKRCFVEDVEYRYWTFVDDSIPNKSRTTTIYSCEEIWEYDFMVVDAPSPYEENNDNYIQNAMHSLVEVKLACKYKSCDVCNDMLGEYTLNGGKSTVDGFFVTECWASTEMDLEKVHPFWECSELKVDGDLDMNKGANSDSACYLFRDPKDILDEYWKESRRFLLIGGILFVPSVLIYVFRVYACFASRRELRE